MSTYDEGEESVSATLDEVGGQDEKNNEPKSVKDIFGSDSESEDETENNIDTVTENGELATSNSMKSIFGEDSDTDSDHEGRDKKENLVKEEDADIKKEIKSESTMDFMYEGEDDQGSVSKLKSTHAKLCIPETRKISSEAVAFSLKLPNFLKLQTKPYDKQLHSEETETSLFHGATSMIRWRYKLNKDGNIEVDEKGLPVRESNTRLVKWSDGSYQLIVGQEEFDSSMYPVTDSFIYTQRKSALPDDDDPASKDVTEDEQEEIKKDTCLECVGSATERVVLRPSSVVSAAHARLSLAISEKYTRKTKIKDREYDNVMVNAEKDTNARAAAINEEIRRERRRRAQMESTSLGRQGYMKPSMSSRFLEEEDGFDSTSLSAIKKSKKIKVKRKYDSEDEDEDELEDEEDEDNDGFIVNDDEMEDEADENDDSYSVHSDQSNEKDVAARPTKRKKRSSPKHDIPEEEKSSDSDGEGFEYSNTKKPRGEVKAEPKDKTSEEEHMEGGISSQKKRRRAVIDSDDEE